MNIFNFRINFVKRKYLRSLYLRFFKNLKFNLVHVFNNVFDLLIFEAVFLSASKSEYIIPNEYYCKMFAKRKFYSINIIFSNMTSKFKQLKNIHK